MAVLATLPFCHRISPKGPAFPTMSQSMPKTLRKQTGPFGVLFVSLTIPRLSSDPPAKSLTFSGLNGKKPVNTKKIKS